MECLLCGHEKAHKHGKSAKGLQRYKCPQCNQTFPEHFNTIYYNRHLSSDEVHTILQSHGEGSSLRGVWSKVVGDSSGRLPFGQWQSQSPKKIKLNGLV